MIVSRPALVDREHIPAGIGWMLLTAAFFVALDTLAKYLLQTYPLVQVVWARFFFHLIVVALIIGPRFTHFSRPHGPGLQFVRSLLLLVTTGLYFAGIHFVPLAKASAIMFLSPILVTVLSIPLLGEKVGLRRWSGVLVGFAGAMVIVRPNLGALETASLLLLIATFTNACYQITTRRLRLVDHPLTTLFYTALLGAVVLSIAVPFFWRAPTPAHWALMAAMGACGGIGHLCLIQAFRAAPASVVAPFAYSNLLWATLAGFLVFGELPERLTIVGAVIIAASGLYILYRERRLKVGEEASRRAPPLEPGPPT